MFIILEGLMLDAVAIYIWKFKHAPSVIVGVVETHLCKLCVILRSCVLLGACPH